MGPIDGSDCSEEESLPDPRDFDVAYLSSDESVRAPIEAGHGARWPFGLTRCAAHGTMPAIEFYGALGEPPLQWPDRASTMLLTPQYALQEPWSGRALAAGSCGSARAGSSRSVAVRSCATCANPTATRSRSTTAHGNTRATNAAHRAASTLERPARALPRPNSARRMCARSVRRRGGAVRAARPVVVDAAARRCPPPTPGDVSRRETCQRRIYKVTTTLLHRRFRARLVPALAPSGVS